MIKEKNSKSSSHTKAKTNRISLLNIEKSIFQQFKSRYSNDRDFYNKKIINEIIGNETAHIVALFKDYLITDDASEFLHSYYTLPDSLGKLPKIFDYYDCCSMIFPNYVVLHEKKYICKNIQRKQRIIDLQQAQDEKRERRSKEIKSLESSIDTVFNTKTFDSLLNVTGNSIIMKAVGNYYASIGQSKRLNNSKGRSHSIEDSVYAINNVIDTINECERKYAKQIENKSMVQRVAQLIEKNMESECNNANQSRKRIKICYKNYLTTEANTKSTKTLSDDHKNNNNSNSNSNSKGRALTIQMQTISNISSSKLRISSIGITQPNKVSKIIRHKNTLSMPKLSPSILDIVTNHNHPLIKPVVVKEASENKINTQPQHNIIHSNTSEYAPLTSRGNNIKSKLNLKTDLSEKISIKKYQNANGSKKHFNSISTATPSLSLKTQQNQLQLQQQLQTEQTLVNKDNKEKDKINSQHERVKTERIYCKVNQSPRQKLSNPVKQNNNNNQLMYQHIQHIKHIPKSAKSISSANKKKKGYENLYDKYSYNINQSEHRNNRNGGFHKVNPGFVLSYDFSSNPISDTLKTTRQVTFSNEIQKKRDQKVKSDGIKGFDKLLRKENGMVCYNSDRDNNNTKPSNGLIANIKYQKIKK